MYSWWRWYLWLEKSGFNEAVEFSGFGWRGWARFLICYWLLAAKLTCATLLLRGIISLEDYWLEIELKTVSSKRLPRSHLGNRSGRAATRLTSTPLLIPIFSSFITIPSTGNTFVSNPQPCLKPNPKRSSSPKSELWRKLQKERYRSTS